MVSSHTPPSPTTTEMMQECQADHGSSTKKRKLENSQAALGEKIQHKTQSTRSLYDANLCLEIPSLPLEWQRCLDIKSGQLYFYNTGTCKNAATKPRSINQPELLTPSGMSLELKLNLPCGSVRKNHNNEFNCAKLQCFGDLINDSREDEKKSGGLGSSPSWLTFEGDQKEMVTAVCNKCHMLVMMCKSSPSCPNCKFVHPPDQNPPSLFTAKVKPLILKGV